MKRHRLEDLGKLSILIEDLYDHELFVSTFWNFPKFTWTSFVELDEDQKEEVIIQTAYMIENIREKLGMCLEIANGIYDEKD